MRPYIKYQGRDASHPNGKPTPKYARTRASKKATRRLGKIAIKQADKDK